MNMVIPVIWTCITLWCGTIVLAATGAVYTMYRKHCLKKRLFLFQVRLNSLLSPQLGELDPPTDKDVNRNRWMRHKRTNPQRNNNTKGRKHWKKVWRARNRKQKPPYTPQMGYKGITEAFSQLANIDGIPLDDKLLSRVENLGAVFVAMKDCNTSAQFFAILFLYLKTEYSKSVANSAATYIGEVLETTFDPQVGEFGVIEDKPVWLKLLKECQENWTLVIRNDGFKKISHVISLCLALGLCDSSDVEFRIGGMKMFALGAHPKHASAIDLVDAAFETIVYFAEGGYMCFKRGSIKPLLYGNFDNEQFEEAYAQCQRCNEYARSGNLEKFEKNEEGKPMDENDYERLLDRTIEKCHTLKHHSGGQVEKNILARKLDQLRSWQATFRQTRVQGGLREAPYSIGLFGGTAVGKSTLANILMVTTLLVNGYTATDDRVVTINESDRFMSNYRSFINGILVDDIGNTRSDFVEKAPTALLVQLVNNVRCYANMAEADMKGKVSIEPKVVISTKNVKDSCAHVYSNEPASITRRDRITVTVTVKPQYATHGMLDDRKVKKLCPHLASDADFRIPDLWNLHVQRSYPIPSPHTDGVATVGWETVVADGKTLENISLAELIRWVAGDSRVFYENQAKVVRDSNNLSSKMNLCPSCRLPRPDVCTCFKKLKTYMARLGDRCVESGYCTACEAYHGVPEPLEHTCALDSYNFCSTCNKYHEVEEPEAPDPPKPMDTQFGEKIARALLKTGKQAYKAYFPTVTYFSVRFEECAADWILSRLVWLEESPFAVWTNYIPSDLIDKPWMKNIVWWSAEEQLTEKIRASYITHLCVGAFNILVAVFYWKWLALLLIPNLIGVCGVVEREKQYWYDKISEDNKAMPKVFRMYRDRHVKWITGTCAVIAACVAIAMVWRALRIIPNPQGNLAPKKMADIVQRDSEVNPWIGAVASPMPCSEKSKTTMPDTLSDLVTKNLCYMELEIPGEDGTSRKFECDAFFPKSNVALVPQHMWKSKSIKVNFTRHDPGLIGGNFTALISKNHSVDIPNTDLSLVWVPNGGDWKDLTPYLPLDRFADVPARLLHKRADGSVVTSKLKMAVGPVHTTEMTYFGAEYDLTFDTFKGLCMSPIVTETKGPLIGGFHLGGRTGEAHGCSGLLLKDQLDKAFEELRAKPGLMLSKSSGTMPKELYDVQFFQGTEIHPKSAINYLPPGANCKYYGQVKGRAKHKTEVEETVISPIVDEVCGVPQQWGGPKFNQGYPFQASLQYSVKPSAGVEGHLLEAAVEDYVKPMLEILDEFPELKASIKPLTNMETVCGIDGKRFIDKMPPNTSVGYPLTGPKSNYLTPLDPKLNPSHQNPVELDDRFWKEAERMEEAYLRGERCYPIFNACLKDEATKLDKDKVRVFQAAPIALQLLIRKYYLPIARFMSLFPLLSECAVGINAQGPEWDELAKFVAKYGIERILAGDYSKYDLRMAAQLVLAALSVMRDIARFCGYSSRSLTIMEGIATDICYPLMAYNGDLIQLFGSNPSGQNLTVYVNSIVNSLLFRCAYFHLHETLGRKPPPFRQRCALGTYGDDAKSSVHEQLPQFNHIFLADFLKQRDIVFTMPDKTSSPTEYMFDETADFLRRKNVYSPDTDHIMAALDEDSIFKSLHATLKSSSITRQQAAMQNIDGALREWFAHGREVYESRRAEMIEIAKRADIIHGCTVVHETYDDRLKVWEKKYLE